MSDPPLELAEPSAPCPNCGTPWPENAPACPNCGRLRPAVWPPAPAGSPAAAPPPATRLVTRSETGDILLGLGVSVAALLAGIGFLLLPILYFVLKRQTPTFARGLGFGWLAGTALLLGALGVCFYALSQNPNGVL